MTVVSATEAKNRFGECMEKAQHEPVLVEKQGRGCVVILSTREYERLQAAEDRTWGELARAAEAGGYLSAAETLAYLSEK
jgi:prevent-host-death family protein